MIDETPKPGPGQPLDLDLYIPEGWQGKHPPCLIQVDAEGRLSHQGAPMIHPGILELIYQNVHLEDGVYVLRLGRQVCQLEVADTFFVVARVEQGQDGLALLLNDGGQEPLDPASLWIGAGEVIYCLVKGGHFPARFLRPAYYQIAELVVEGPAGFELELAGVRHRLPRRE